MRKRATNLFWDGAWFIGVVNFTVFMKTLRALEKRGIGTPSPTVEALPSKRSQSGFESQGGPRPR